MLEKAEGKTTLYPTDSWCKNNHVVRIENKMMGP
jgi:hypothetical protein